MRFEIVLGLISTFQIYHQSLSNTLAMLDFGYSVMQLSLISAVFPIGKFFGTISIILLFRKNYSNKQCIDYAAGLIIIGALLMLVPSFFLLCFSRLIIGAGVGMAFIAAFIALTDFSNFVGQCDEPQNYALTREERCQIRKLSSYFSTAILFAAAIFFANISVFFNFASEFTQICVFAFPAIFSGLNYFLHRNTVDKQLPPSFHQAGPSIDCNSENIFEKTNLNFGKQSAFKSGLTAQSRASTERTTDLKCSPFALALILLSINATIGVPIILAYSSIIYRSFGISQRSAIFLSTVYPLIQLGVMSVFCYSTKSYNSIFFSKRAIVLVGYGICLAATFFLLITLFFDTLETNLAAKRMFSSFWFTILAIATAPPCNAGVAAITAGIFPNRSALIEGMATSRAFFWVFSSTLCGAFLHILESDSLFLAFFLCFCASLLAYAFLYAYFPHCFIENETDFEGIGFPASEIINLEYGTAAHTSAFC